MKIMKIVDMTIHDMGIHESDIPFIESVTYTCYVQFPHILSNWGAKLKKDFQIRKF